MYNNKDIMSRRRHDKIIAQRKVRADRKEDVLKQQAKARAIRLGAAAVVTKK
jgi:hypothetical protein